MKILIQRVTGAKLKAQLWVRLIAALIFIGNHSDTVEGAKDWLIRWYICV
jgi:hypothetical protein